MNTRFSLAPTMLRDISVVAILCVPLYVGLSEFLDTVLWPFIDVGVRSSDVLDGISLLLPVLAIGLSAFLLIQTRYFGSVALGVLAAAGVIGALLNLREMSVQPVFAAIVLFGSLACVVFSILVLRSRRRDIRSQQQRTDLETVP